MTPGNISETLIPYLLNSAERDSVNPFTACLDAEYTEVIGKPIIPVEDDVFKHNEFLVFFKRSIAEYIPFITPKRLIFTTLIWLSIG